MNPESFLHDWFRDCPGVIELRPLPSKAQSYHDTPEDLLKASGRCNGEAVYFGVATRDGFGGAKENIVAIPGVWCDVDFKDTPKDEAKKLLGEFPVKPTFAIASGGGWHLYWKFKEPAAKDEFPALRPSCGVSQGRSKETRKPRTQAASCGCRVRSIGNTIRLYRLR